MCSCSAALKSEACVRSLHRHRDVRQGARLARETEFCRWPVELHGMQGGSPNDFSRSLFGRVM